MNRLAVLVMTKAPRPGQTKTRLEPLLGADGCARLQAALIRHAVRWAARMADGSAFVAYAPRDARDEVAELSGAGVRVFAQAPGDLGVRLAAATNLVFALHRGPMVVVGTDLPALGERHADAVRDALTGGADVCLGPAADGGYYLIALARPTAELFRLEPETWGGPRVLELTLRAAQARGLQVAMLEPECDLDTPSDALTALGDPRTPADIAAILHRALAGAPP